VNPTAKEALRTLARIGARAAARAAAEVVASATDDLEDLVEVGKQAAEDFFGDIRQRVRKAKDTLPSEREMQGKPPKKRRP